MDVALIDALDACLKMPRRCLSARFMPRAADADASMLMLLR